MPRDRPPAGDDLLLPAAARGFPPRWYERAGIVVQSSADAPAIVVASHLYPGERAAWARVTLADGGRSRTLRFSAPVEGRPRRNTIGPLHWDAIRPWERWRIALDPNPSGLGFELEWNAHGVPWRSPAVQFENRTGYVHAFQSGTCTGWVTVDDRRRHEITDWYGHRDRSRGVHPGSGEVGLELHVMCRAADETLAFVASYDPDNTLIALAGAHVPLDGVADLVAELAHDFELPARGSGGRGRLRTTTASGRSVDLEFDLGDVRDEDDAPGPDVGFADLSPIAGRRATFRSGRTEIGTGVVAIRRSRAYTYVPTLAPAS